MVEFSYLEGLVLFNAYERERERETHAHTHTHIYFWSLTTLYVGNGVLFDCNLYSFCNFRALCVRVPQSIPRLVTCLNQYVASTVEPQRIVVVAFYAEVCCHTAHTLTQLCSHMLYFCVHSSDKNLLDYSGNFPFRKWHSVVTFTFLIAIFACTY